MAVAVVVGLDSLHDNSFLTHLATGRIILADGIPRADPYSFTALGEPWVVQSWLASLIYAVLERWFGLDAIRWLTGALCGATVAVIWSATASASSLLPRVLVASGCATATALAWSERPLMFGLVAFGLCLLAAHGRLPGWVLLMVGWVWVNTHGSFPLGLVLLGVIALGERFDGERRPVGLHALAWLGSGVVLGVVNPLGWRLLWFPLELLGRSGHFRSTVVEWKPPAFDSPPTLAFLALLLAAVVASTRARELRLVLPVVVFTGAALYSQRNIPLAAMTIAPLLAAAAPRLGSLRSDHTPRRAPVALGLVLVAAVSASVLFVRSTPAVMLGAYPEAEIDWLEASGVWESPARIVTPDYVGNYLTARFGATGRVFFDDRFDMYPRQVFDDYRALKVLDDPARVLEQWEIDVVVWRRDEALAVWLDLSPQWEVGTVGERHAVWCRTDGDPTCPTATSE